MLLDNRHFKGNIFGYEVIETVSRSESGESQFISPCCWWVINGQKWTVFCHSFFSDKYLEHLADERSSGARRIRSQQCVWSKYQINLYPRGLQGLQCQQVQAGRWFVQVWSGFPHVVSCSSVFFPLTALSVLFAVNKRMGIWWGYSGLYLPEFRIDTALGSPVFMSPSK